MSNGLAVIVRVACTMAILVLAGFASGCTDYAAGPDPSPADYLADPAAMPQGSATR